MPPWSSGRASGVERLKIQTELSKFSISRDTVPVCRPLLPSAAAILPYLERIDTARWYSNHGPLVMELQNRLSGLLADQYVAVASSGTLAIAGAILAVAGRAKPGRRKCLMPANTFIGSVVAVEQCGYEPHFVDVDRDTWQLVPDALEGHEVLSEAGLVLVVSPYGRGVLQAPWERFRDKHGIAVVIDGAAMIEAAMNDPASHIGTVPVALSFHATKSFATGEGGAVVTSRESIWKAAIQAMNFGFLSDRRSQMPSINAKMSEYHAAVGLAELDGWEAKREGYRRAAGRLRRVDALAGSLVTAPDLASCYAMHVAATPAEGREIRRKLGEAGIGCRQWYGAGAHAHPSTSRYGRDTLEVTEHHLETATGLPMFPDLSEGDREMISGALARPDSAAEMAFLPLA